jgi:hypothetical protein
MKPCPIGHSVPQPPLSQKSLMAPHAFSECPYPPSTVFNLPLNAQNSLPIIK